MRIGLILGGNKEVQDNVRAAVEADQDGFDSIWYAQILGPDVLSVIALAGPRTTKIELGTSVVPIYTRHPVAMAQQALTTQAATGGRFSLGVGLSHRPVVEGMWGLSYDRPAIYMREYLSVLRQLLKEERVDFDGDLFRVNARVQVPVSNSPPVLVAALAPVMLRIAGELADGTVTWMVGPKTLETHIVPRITSSAEAAGRPTPRVVMALPTAITDDADEGRRRAAELFQGYDALPNYRRVLDIEGAAGPAEVAVVGNEEEVESQLRRIAAKGATDFLAWVFSVGDDTHASLTRTRSFLKGLVGVL